MTAFLSMYAGPVYLLAVIAIGALLVAIVAATETKP